MNAAEYGNAVDAYQAEVTWRQELEAFKAENPGGWAKGNPEVRLLPPELAALRYEGGP